MKRRLWPVFARSDDCLRRSFVTGAREGRRGNEARRRRGARWLMNVRHRANAIRGTKKSRRVVISTPTREFYRLGNCVRTVNFNLPSPSSLSPSVPSSALYLSAPLSLCRSFVTQPHAHAHTANSTRRFERRKKTERLRVRG